MTSGMEAPRGGNQEYEAKGPSRRDLGLQRQGHIEGGFSTSRENVRQTHQERESTPSGLRYREHLDGGSQLL